jgi:hypothetical protein
MLTIHLDYLTVAAAIDIFALLSISIGIIREIHRNHPP